MEKYVIKQLSRRGEEHRDFCEDSSLHLVIDNFIFSIVLDGCSSGYESHFASTLFKKIFKSILRNTDQLSNDKEINVYHLIERFYNRLISIVDKLELSIDEILSTIVLSCTDIKTKSSYAIIIGDGVISVDGKILANIEPKNNAPDYIAYHIDESLYNIWDKYIFKYEIENIKNTISICTDGIMSFKAKEKLVENFEHDFLLIDKRFLDKENMLSRKCNILNNQHNTYHGDDLSIIRIDFKDATDENL
jgi:hypothetical protein